MQSVYLCALTLPMLVFLTGVLVLAVGGFVLAKLS